MAYLGTFVGVPRHQFVVLWTQVDVVVYAVLLLCVAKQFKYPDCEQRKPPVPRPNDRPVMGLRTTKDYITQNAVENINSVARRPDKTYVDTRRGDKHSLIPSGLEPLYVHKKVYRVVVLNVQPFIGTLKLHSNAPLYSSTVISTLAGLLHLVQRGGAS